MPRRREEHRPTTDLAHDYLDLDGLFTDTELALRDQVLGMHLDGHGCPGRSAVEYGIAAMELEGI